ncbi:MAG: hypothetical protein WC906_02405 [Parcubacteria group bacterium]|jgi:hypothetical protein
MIALKEDEMKIGKKRMKEILSIIAREVLLYISASDIVLVFEGQKTWEECFKRAEEREGEVGIIAKAIGNGRNQISEEEFDEIARPFVASRIAYDLGAEKVKIKW